LLVFDPAWNHRTAIDPQLNFIRFLLRPHLASETGKATNILARSGYATIRNSEAPLREPMKVAVSDSQRPDGRAESAK
jgi:hypothetical protein